MHSKSKIISFYLIIPDKSTIIQFMQSDGAKLNNVLAPSFMLQERHLFCSDKKFYVNKYIRYSGSSRMSDLHINNEWRNPQ